MSTVWSGLTLPSARLTPVKYLFTRKGLVRVAVREPEDVDEPIGTRVEHVIEVALPFVDDFSQNGAESGDTIELKVCLPLSSNFGSHCPLP